MDVARADESPQDGFSGAASPFPLPRAFHFRHLSSVRAGKANTNSGLSQKVNNPFATVAAAADGRQSSSMRRFARRTRKGRQSGDADGIEMRRDDCKEQALGLERGYTRELPYAPYDYACSRVRQRQSTKTV
ncbi:hypothetical protein MRX96_042282 [Rhipicephalus microplus]